MTLRPAWACLVLGFLAAWPLATWAQSPIRIGNLDNRIAVQAGDSAPELLQLARPGGVAWQGAAAAA